MVTNNARAGCSLRCRARGNRTVWHWSMTLALLTAACGWCRQGQAQIGLGFRQAVGGIAIDAQGVVCNAPREMTDVFHQERLAAQQPVPGEIDEPAELRKISLRGLQAAMLPFLAAGKPVPDEMRFLAGIQRIRYLFVYPETQDIVLAGYAEGWRVDPRGNIIGKTTGRPVIEIDDLLVALRTAEPAARGGISCSIDPTQEGLKQVREYLGSAEVIGVEAAEVAKRMEEMLGPQKVTITGVPLTSHFARVLLAADYRMKRLGMGFERAPVRGLPSYLQMLKGDGLQQNLLPRWWLATDYEPLLTDGEGLSWELRGQGVKGMSEDDLLAADGTRQQTGKAQPQASQWADNMTKHFDELSVKEPIFGELRNCMDLAVLAALVVKEGLVSKAGCDLSLLLDPSRLPIGQLIAPRQLPTKANFIEKRTHFAISASGGVQVDSWAAADKKETSDELNALRKAADAAQRDLWWWN